ncbi:MAG: glycoside hydrolase family 99-like domain-containing protein [Nitrososphaeria archaeon]
MDVKKKEHRTSLAKSKKKSDYGESNTLRRYKGQFDGIRDTYYVEGWVYNESNPNEKVKVEVYVDGVSVAEGIANLYREDLINIENKNHGFRIRLPDNLIDGKEHEVLVKIKGSNLSIIGPVNVVLNRDLDLVGNIDGIDEVCIFGWALDNRNPERKLKVAIYLEGELLGEGIADQYREDLKKEGFGDGRFGFKIDLPKSLFDRGGQTKEFQLKVNGMTIDTKEFVVPEIKPRFQGNLDIIEDLSIIGWAWDRENPEKKLKVSIYVNGEFVGEGVANQYRKDLEEAGIGDGMHGFRVELPKFLLERESEQIGEFQLKIDNKIIASSKFAIPKTGSKIRGNIDTINGLYLFGWAMDEERPNTRAEIVVYVDGKLVGEGVASHYREDLEKAGIGDGKYGFMIKLPEEIFDGNKHEIRVKIKSSHIELNQSPLYKELSPIYAVIEKITPHYISGFAVDLTDPFKSLVVSLIIQDEVLVKTRCTIGRSDLLKEPTIALHFNNINLRSPLWGFKILLTKQLIEKILRVSDSLCGKVEFKIRIENLEIKLRDLNIDFFGKQDTVNTVEDRYLIKVVVKQRAYEDKINIAYDANKERDIKLISFYLPQFYPFSENNEWWGEGFTEWNQIVNSKPFFEGHYQPRIPADLGFYDLRLREVRKKQEMLAKEFGIYGFCYYYYWFSGKTLMDEIVKDVLISGIPDLPFCLCWANEPWSRRWDGSDQEILMPQLHDLEIDEKLILDIMPYLEDPRYIKVEGKPIVIVYNVGRIPNPNELFTRWRHHAKQAGFPGIYIIIAQTFGVMEPYSYGADAAVEFPPHQVSSIEITKDLVKDEGFEGHVFDYREVVAREIMKTAPSYTLYRALMTGWDNSPRKGRSAHIFHYSTPEYYEIWLRHLVDYTRRNLPPDRRFIFINAWNEWAESTYLEPDRKNGKAYLQATKRALFGASDPNSLLEEAKILINDNPKMRTVIQPMIDYIVALRKTYNIVMKNVSGYLNMIDLSISKPVKVTKLYVKESRKDVNFNIENINQFSPIPTGKGEVIIIDNYAYIEIKGWFVERIFPDPFSFTLYFMFERNDDSDYKYIFPIKNRFPRSDVNQAHNKPSQYPSGFSQYLEVKELIPGEYSLSMLFTEGNLWYRKKANFLFKIIDYGASYE